MRPANVGAASRTPRIAILPRDKGSSATPTWLEAAVVTNRHHSDRYWLMRLETPEIARRCRPGQFVMLTPASKEETFPVLPRPMAVYSVDVDSGVIDIVYGVIGAGTRRMAAFRESERILVVGPLGRGFQVPSEVSTLLILGRGIGSCSLTLLAREQARRGTHVVALASGRHRGAVVGSDEYRKNGITVFEVNDADGSSAIPAVSALLTETLDARPPGLIAACGSNRLMALSYEFGSRWGSPVQVSLEAHMACGIGYCHGCASGRRSSEAESPLICRDGPVFQYI